MSIGTQAVSAHPGLGGIRLVLGGNVFGWTVDRDQSFRLLDAFYEAGGRSIDSADGYSSWVPGNKGGESEAIIGAWMEARGVRADMRIGTKTGMGGTPGGLAPDRLSAALDASLERLRTDYVDLYYAHRDEPQTPLDEVAAGFDALVKSGKVRELGASNFTPDRLEQALDSAERQGLAAYTVLQPGYNLVWRGEFPPALHDLAVARGLAVVPFYGLAAGFLSGKYRSEADFTGQRGGSAKMFAADGWKALPTLEAVAHETGGTMAQVALAWLATRPAIWAPIASATTLDQLASLTASARMHLSPEQVSRLTAVSVDAGT